MVGLSAFSAFLEYKWSKAALGCALFILVAGCTMPGCGSEREPALGPGVWVDDPEEGVFGARLELSSGGRFVLQIGIYEYLRVTIDRSGRFEESDGTIVLDPIESSGRIDFIFDAGSDTMRLAPSTDEDLEFKGFLKDLGKTELVLARER